MIKVTCATCGIVFGLAKLTHAARENDGATFYCPSGHTNVYRPSQNSTLRTRAKMLEDDLAGAVKARDGWRDSYFEIHDQLLEEARDLTTEKLRVAGYKSQWLKQKHLAEDRLEKVEHLSGEIDRLSMFLLTYYADDIIEGSAVDTAMQALAKDIPMHKACTISFDKDSGCQFCKDYNICLEKEGGK